MAQKKVSSLSSKYVFPPSRKLECLLLQELSKRKIKGGVKSLYTSDIAVNNISKIAQNIMREDCQNVCILVGTANCPLYWPPTDTDNTAGALAIAKCLLLMNKKVFILCDDVNDGQIRPAVLKSEAWQMKETSPHLSDKLVYESFPSVGGWTDEWEKKLKGIFDSVQHIINVGRIGPNKDASLSDSPPVSTASSPTSKSGSSPVSFSSSDSSFSFALYLNGECRDISHWQPPFYKLFHWAQHSKLNENSPVYTSVIAELGNELGMGMLQKEVEDHVQDGKKIACKFQADFVIVCTVVNWGALALCGYMGGCFLQADKNDKISETGKDNENEKYGVQTIDDFSLTKETYHHILKTLNEEACRCGVSGTKGELVDGFDLADNFRLIDLIMSECKCIFQEECDENEKNVINGGGGIKQNEMEENKQTEKKNNINDESKNNAHSAKKMNYVNGIDTENLPTNVIV